MKSDFDLEKAIQEALEGQSLEGGSRLAFADKCEAFAALKIGVKASVVMQAYGLTRATVSYLKNAGRGGRYYAIKREFEGLGDKGFLEKYYTDEVHARIMRVKHQIAEPSDLHGPRGPNPRADKWSFNNSGAFETKYGYMRIDWKKLKCEYPEIREGWYFIECLPDGQPNPAGLGRYQGQESILRGQALREMDPDYRKPYLTSSAAHQGALIFSGDRIKSA